MANSYDAVGQYFDLDTDTDIDGLNTLKGSDPGQGDTVYVSEGARLTVNRDADMLTAYLGDNYGGTASVKTGHLEISAGATLTFYTTTLHGGLGGEGSTSTVTLSGTGDANRAGLVCATNDKCTNYNILNCRIQSDWGLLQGVYTIYFGAAHCFRNTLFDNVNRGCSFVNGYSKPESLDGCEFRGCVFSIYDTTTTAPMGWGDFFAENEIKLTGNANGASQISMSFCWSGNYLYQKQASGSIRTAPAWDTTSGVQSLTPNGNATLTASWNTASHASGADVSYRIYIRNGAAPDEFGVSSSYYLAETPAESFIIAGGPGGQQLTAGDEYYVTVRAATALGGEDANTVSLREEVSGGSDERIERIDGVTQVLLALALSA